MGMSRKSMLVGSCISMVLIAGVGLWAAAATHSTTELYRFSDGSMVGGSRAALVRTDAGVTVTIKTSDLEPGAAYTVWWVVFNRPEFCQDGGCGEADLGNDDVEPSVVYATGHVLGRNGVGDFGAHLSMGDTTGALFGPGLLYPRTAEIHNVVRGHGQPIPGMVDEQIHTIDGGCAINTCVDKQFARHLP